MLKRKIKKTLHLENLQGYIPSNIRNFYKVLCSRVPQNLISPQKDQTFNYMGRWYSLNHRTDLTFRSSNVLTAVSCTGDILMTTLKSNRYSLESSLITELQNTVFMKIVYLGRKKSLWVGLRDQTEECS